MKNLKSVLIGVVVSVLSVSSVQAAPAPRYDTFVDEGTSYDGNGGSTSTTYSAVLKVSPSNWDGGANNEYMSYTSTNTEGDGVNTGDKLLASANVSNSGDATELKFIEDVLGSTIFGDFDFSYKNEDKLSFSVNSSATTGLSTLTSSTSIDLPSGGYFLLKFGGGNGNTDQETFWLFDNSESISNFTWLTMINPINTGNGGGLLGLSHFRVGCVKNADGVCESRIPGDVSNVPIPAAIWLFGSALLGLTAFGSKKKAA